MQNNNDDLTSWVFGDKSEVVIHTDEGSDLNEWLFGDAAKPVAEAATSAIKNTTSKSAEVRRKVNDFLGIDSSKAKSPHAMLRSGVDAFTQAITKDNAGVTPAEVDRVDAVLSLADKLMLKRDNVMALIKKLGFDEVESTIAILAGESVNKSLRDVMGLPVTHVTIADVEQITKARVTKESTSSLERFFPGLKFK